MNLHQLNIRLAGACVAAALVACGVATAQATARPAPPQHRPGTAPPQHRPGTAPPQDRPGTAPSASPHILPFAGHVGAGRVPLGPLTRRSGVSVPAQIDGCDHNYGRVGQCVPWSFPPGVSNAGDKCAWLSSHGLHSLPVRGKDRQHLDPTGSGVACAR